MFGVSDIYCRGLGPITRLEGFVLGFKGFITAPGSGLWFREGILMQLEEVLSIIFFRPSAFEKTC